MIKHKYLFKKFLAFFFIFSLIFPLISNFSFATSDPFVSDNYHIYSTNEPHTYITYEERTQTLYEYYYLASDGSKVPAYCLTLGKNGAETFSNGYDVTSKKYISDPTLKNIIFNGYPYKSQQELMVNSESEAIYATQFAIWAYLNNFDLGKIKPIDTNYACVSRAILSIYIYGTQGFFKYSDGITVNQVEKESYLDEFNKEYYSVTYDLDYGKNVKEINVDVKNANDYIITDEYNNKIYDIVDRNKIKILFPRKSNKGVNADITFSCKYNNDAIVSAENEEHDTQDVCFSILPFKEQKQNFNFTCDEIKTNLTIQKIEKIDPENFNIIPIPNTVFDIYSKGKYIKTVTTDEDGNIALCMEDDLGIYNEQMIDIKEVSVPSPYIIGENNVTSMMTTPGFKFSVEIQNEKEIEEEPIKNTEPINEENENSKEDNKENDLTKTIENSSKVPEIITVIDEKIDNKNEVVEENKGKEKEVKIKEIKNIEKIIEIEKDEKQANPALNVLQNIPKIELPKTGF